MATADLLQAMRKQAKPTAVNPSPTEDPVPDGGGETAVPPSRAGKRQVAAYFPVPVQRQLKLLTIEKDHDGAGASGRSAERSVRQIWQAGNCAHGRGGALARLSMTPCPAASAAVSAYGGVEVDDDDLRASGRRSRGAALRDGFVQG